MHRIGAEAEAARQNFHSAVGGLTKQLPVARIGAVAWSKGSHVRTAEAGHQHRSRVRKDPDQLNQMLLPRSVTVSGNRAVLPSVQVVFFTSR